MSPPPPRGGRRGDDNELENILRRTRRRRTAGKAKRKRRTTLILTVALVLVLALIASGVGGVAAFRSSCNLDTLRPVEIGQNSFVFAANGSLLGSRGAEPHAGQALAGQPLDEEGDRRDRGPPLLQPRRRRLRGHRTRRLEGHQRR